LPPVPVISIIDDDASIRVATNRLIRSLGYVAHTFASAEEFLAAPEANQTSCMIVDVQMPGMSGIELQGLLLAQGRRMPIIFITAFPEPRIRDCVMAKGALAFLEKPFDGSKLVSLIRDAMAAQ
jgi:FixJ family two-component response regulator